jgi:hypothetical protein
VAAIIPKVRASTAGSIRAIDARLARVNGAPLRPDQGEGHPLHRRRHLDLAEPAADCEQHGHRERSEERGGREPHQPGQRQPDDQRDRDEHEVSSAARVDDASTPLPVRWLEDDRGDQRHRHQHDQDPQVLHHRHHAIVRAEVVRHRPHHPDAPPAISAKTPVTGDTSSRKRAAARPPPR